MRENHVLTVLSLMRRKGVSGYVFSPVVTVGSIWQSPHIFTPCGEGPRPTLRA